ncbi:hypothetical protein SBA2_180015 [Acidobacteriia bacterium SbA2]|nr:hypothetical protein SBA2_180015 [Acidobacteriia bacterium SbA2]
MITFRFFSATQLYITTGKGKLYRYVVKLR